MVIGQMGGSNPQEGGNNIKQQVKQLIESFQGEDREILEQYMQIPNIMPSMPEAYDKSAAFHQKYRSKATEIMDRVEEGRKKMGIRYDELQKEILKQLGK